MIRPHIFETESAPFAIYRKIKELMKISFCLILPAKIKIVSAAKKRETVKVKVKVKPWKTLYLPIFAVHLPLIPTYNGAVELCSGQSLPKKTTYSFHPSPKK